MIYFLISFLFSFVGFLIVFIVIGKLKKTGHVYLHADKSVVTAIHKEAKEQREGLVLKACNDFLKDKPVFVPDILIEAKKRGYFDKRNRYCDDYTFYSLVTVNENLIVISCAYNPTGMFFNPCLINPRINVEVYKNGLWADIKKAEPENVRVGDEPIVKLHAPAKYSLEECLSELKFGRTAEDQKMIDMFIDQLNNPPCKDVVKEEETFPNFKAGNLIIVNSPLRHLIGRLDEDSNYQIFHFEWYFDLKEKLFKKDMGVILSAQHECIPGIVKLAEEEDEEVYILNKEQFNQKKIQTIS